MKRKEYKVNINVLGSNNGQKDQDFLKGIKGLPPNEQEYKRKFLLAQVLNKLGVWP